MQMVVADCLVAKKWAVQVKPAACTESVYRTPVHARPEMTVPTISAATTVGAFPLSYVLTFRQSICAALGVPFLLISFDRPWSNATSAIVKS